MKSAYGILWIEDKKRIISAQEAPVRDFLAKLDYELHLHIDNDGSKYKQILRKECIDLIVTDYNIDEETNGVKIVEQIRGMNILTDILFYSAQSIEDDCIYRDLGQNGLVEVVDGKDIVDDIKKLITKSLKRCEDIVFMRGLIISRCIDLELKLNEFFGKYFKVPAEMIENFHDLVLENPTNSFYAKKLVLEKTKGFPKKKIESLNGHITAISKDRNLFAHCKKGNGNFLVHMGDKQEFDRPRLNKTLNLIRRTSEEIDDLMGSF